MDNLNKLIYIQSDWIYEKYTGWSIVYECQGVKILRKRYGLIWKLLLMTQKDFNQDISKILTQLRLINNFTIIIWHDFSDRLEHENRLLTGKSLKLINNKQILVNLFTFIIDISLSNEELWKNLGQKSRNMIRKAEAYKVESTIIEEPTSQQLNIFFNLYKPIAQANNLAMPSRKFFEKMFDDKKIFLCLSNIKGEQPLLANIIYTTKYSGFYLYGASSKNRVTGIGQHAQWEIIKHLKSKGYAWYDLGGVPNTDKSNGIYKFKKSMGGEFVNLGREYIYIPKLIITPYRIFKNIKQLL